MSSAIEDASEFEAVFGHGQQEWTTPVVAWHGGWLRRLFRKRIPMIWVDTGLVRADSFDNLVRIRRIEKM